MGTNYYAYENCCDKCGRKDITHIGKSSAGWPFSIHCIEYRGINSWHDWCCVLEKGVEIRDEYGKKIPLIDLHDLIVSKRKHAQEPHVIECYMKYPDHATPCPVTGDKLSYGDFS